MTDELLAAGVNELTGRNWGDLLADAIATPGVYRGKLSYLIAGECANITANDRGEVVTAGVGIIRGDITDCVLSIWGRMKAEAGRNVRQAIDDARAAAGLSPLFKPASGWRIVATGIDNPAVDWGKFKPQPPCWFVAQIELK
jgi:hypothetical protein